MSEEGQQSNSFDQPLRDKIFTLKRYCTRPQNSQCSRCSLVCPHEAITFDDNNTPHIDPQRCTRCGLCRGVCDAFASERITLLDLAKRAHRLAKELGPLFFTCAEFVNCNDRLHQNVFVLPCLASLPPELWANLLLNGDTIYIHCDFDRCKQCECAGEHAEALFSYVFSTAESWSGASFHFSDELPNTESILEFYDNPDEMDRREIFSSVFNEATDITSGKYRQRKSKAQNSFQEQQERMKARGHIQQGNNMTLQEALHPTLTKQRWPRQQLLADALKDNPRQAACITHWFSSTDYNRCQNSQDCIRRCPTHARSIDEKTQAVVVDKRFCIACGACVHVCKNQACFLTEETALELIDQPFDGKENDG